MKTMILVGDGMADWPVEKLGNKTPLEVAATPAMDEVVQNGLFGLFCPIPDGLPPGSDIGNLSLFGYDPHSVYTGRAPLEAARQGIKIGPDEVAFRCNLITLADGIMKSFTSDHISTEEATELIKALNSQLQDLPVKFYSGVSYRHLAVVTIAEENVDPLANLNTTPPHDISDKEYEPNLPSGKFSEIALDIIKRSQDVLRAHPVNQAREAAGKLSATSAWLWGQGRAPSLESYKDRFGITGSVISAVDLIKGIGVCAGLDIIEVPGATGYIDTNYKGKIDAALQAIEEVDFVYLHVEAPDEAGHEGKADLKVQAIEDFDSKIVAPCLDYVRKHGNIRILVAPDHETPVKIKTHAGNPVPFAIYGPGITSNGSTAYTEAKAKETGLLVKNAYKLLPNLLSIDKINPDDLL